MEIEIELNNVSQDNFKLKFFESVSKKTLALCQKEFAFSRKKKFLVSVALIDSLEMKKINRTYRQKNSATDVLSFAEYAGKKKLSEACGKVLFLGELLLCYNYIEKYSESQEDARIEMARVFSHGLLHLLGFRHGKKMFEIQKAVLFDIK